MSTSVLPFTPSINDLHFNTINGVLGNASQSHVSENATLIEKVQAHLNYVLKILESGQFAPTGLTESQKQNRASNIALLHTYAFSLTFPRQFSYPDPSATHRPCFVDDEKRLCAVGYLMAMTGAQELVNQINNEFRFSYIRDMDLSLVEPWREANGFSLIELAMIQPSYSFTKQEYPSPQPMIVHTNVRCDNCGTSPVTGPRYKCVNCANFDLCLNCESQEGVHDRTHVFLKLRYPIVTEPSNTQALLPSITVRPTPTTTPPIPPILRPVD